VSPAQRVRRIIEQAKLMPASASEIASQANLTVSTVDEILAGLMKSGEIVRLHKPLQYVAAPAFERALKRLLDGLRQAHAQSPWKVGLSTAAAAQLLPSDERLAARLLARWEEHGLVSQTQGAWHLPAFQPKLTGQQEEFFAAALAVHANCALQPKSLREVLQRVKVAKVAGLEEALHSQLATGAVVRIGDDLYTSAQIERIKKLLFETLGGGSATLSRLRDVLGTSRKYALPLMEYFDSTGLTVRDGDMRRLRQAQLA
jgi:selenocysteine-specific elongation factor